MLKALFELSRFNLELFFKTYVAVLFTYLMPSALFIAIIKGSHDRPTMAKLITPLFLGMIVAFVSFYTLGTQAVGYREMGFYKRLLVTRVGSIAISISNALLGFVLILLGWLLLTLEGLLIFGVRPAFSVLPACAAILIAGTGMFMLGLIPAIFVKKSQSMFAIASVGTYTAVLFSGVTPTAGKWTGWLHYVDMVSPSFHALRILQAGFSGALFTVPAGRSIVFMIAFIFGCLVVFRRYLSWV